ncbi:MAG: hypothetical protein ACP5UO_04450 [Thermoplasmata archaeon]
MLVTLYNEREEYSFSNKAGLMYVRGLGNVDTGRFSPGETFEIGSRVFRCRKSSVIDVFNSLERGPQAVTPKDASYIGLLLDLPNSGTLLEIGGGSGSFSILSSMLFKVKVTSYELDPETFLLFKRNVRRFEAENSVFPVRGDGRDADPNAFPSIFIDNPEPWNFLSSDLRGERRVASILPTYSQAEEFSRFLSEKGFLVNVHQIVDIPMTLSSMGMRPETSILYHTGFIVSGVLY